MIIKLEILEVWQMNWHLAGFVTGNYSGTFIFGYLLNLLILIWLISGHIFVV